MTASDDRMEVGVESQVTFVEVQETNTIGNLAISDPPVSSVQVTDDLGAFNLVVDETPTYVEVLEDRTSFEVVVTDEIVNVVDVAVQGPQGAPGPQGIPGRISEADAPLSVTGSAIRITPGTNVGQGLLYSGTAWDTAPLIPGGANGTVPFKQDLGLAGDGTKLRYDSIEQALYVPRLGNTLLDGGNF